MNAVSGLFDQELVAVNVGLRTFAESLSVTGAKVIHLDWKPPAAGEPELGRQLALLSYDERLSAKIAQANEEAMERILSAHPLLVDIQPAKEALSVDDNTFLHAGPPIEFADMCGPMQGAAIGATLFEGLANTPDQARRRLEAGGIQFSPCHRYHAVAPMAGLISPSMPVFVVRNDEHGNLAYSNINEGLGKVLRFGAYSEELVERLKWMAEVLGPTLKSVVSEDEPIDLRAITAQALQMGDECHNRNVAATSLLFKQLVGRLLDSDIGQGTIKNVLNFVAANDHFFLNLSMACCKAMLDTAEEIPYSTVVTVMSRNGVEFGVRMSGTGEEWFTAPANLPEGLYLPGYTSDDAALDLGDSSICETAGIGGFVMGTAPAIVGFVGGSAWDALNYTREMRKITLKRNPNYTLPALDFEGAPIGIDAWLVLETGITPLINTGIAHKDAGIGQVGAGIVRAPMSCFTQAIKAFLARIASETE